MFVSLNEQKIKEIKQTTIVSQLCFCTYGESYIPVILWNYLFTPFFKTHIFQKMKFQGLHGNIFFATFMMKKVYFNI